MEQPHLRKGAKIALTKCNLTRILPNEFIKEDDFELIQCGKCKKLLTAQIFTSSEHGNICMNCKDQLKSLLEESFGGILKRTIRHFFEWDIQEAYVRNTFMEKIVSLVQVDCKYKALGCQQMIMCKNYDAHMESCFFGFCECRMCNKLVENQKVLSHLKGNHSIKNIARMDFKISLEDDINWFSYNYEKINIIAIIESVDNSYQVAITTSDVNPPPLNLECTLLIFQQKLVYQITLQFSKLWKPNMTRLTELVQKDPNNRFAFKIVANDSKASKFSKQTVTCPVCFQYLEKPIYQCTNGHYVCNSCTLHMQKQECPVCGKSLVDKVRNSMMEVAIDGVFVECRNESEGCPFVDKMSQINKHMSKCIFAEYECIMQNCTFKARKGALLKHIEENYQTRTNFALIEENIDIGLPHIILDFGGAFLVQKFVRVVQDVEYVCWSAKLAGNCNALRSDFKYQIVIFKKDDKENNIKLESFCCTGNSYSSNVEITRDALKEMCSFRKLIPFVSYKIAIINQN